VKDGAIVCNSRHFDVGLELDALKESSTSRRRIREFVEEFTLNNRHRAYHRGEGRLINLAAAEGHPSSVMDMSFANQALSSEYMALGHSRFKKRVSLSRSGFAWTSSVKTSSLRFSH
jgi:adenosylhomocysteinase